MSKYKREDTEFKAKMAKRFPKHDDRIVTATIDENGDVLFLATHENDAVFLNHGTVVTKRASHVEPNDPVYRFIFHILRFFGNKTKLAEWTRNWHILWRVNTKPVGGPILFERFFDRQEAIDAEIEFLNKFFLEGC